MITIALFDDHIALTDAMRILLNAQDNFKVISVANDFETALSELDTLQCSLAIIDMNMGIQDSCLLISKAEKKMILPIVLSAYSELSMIKRAINSGAKAYISKSVASTYLIEGINCVMSGKNYFDPVTQSVINKLLSPSINKEQFVAEPATISDLTQREKDIIRLIALEYKSDEIAKELFLSKNTVDTYRKNLITKLQVRNSVGLGLFAFKNGLL